MESSSNTLFSLASFSQHSYSEIPPCHCTGRSLPWSVSSGLPLYGCVSVSPRMYIWGFYEYHFLYSQPPFLPLMDPFIWKP